MKKLTIENMSSAEQAAAAANPSRWDQRKSRAFSVALGGRVLAGLLWDNEPSRQQAERPMLTVLGGLDTELAPVVRNLLVGRRALVTDSGGNWEEMQRIELLSSESYAVSYDRACAEDGSSGAALYLKRLLVLDPQSVEEEVRALIVTPRWYTDEENARIQQREPELLAEVSLHLEMLGVVEGGFGSNRLSLPHKLAASELLRLIPQAVRVGTAINRRTRLPLVARVDYYLQIYLAACAWGVASLTHTEQSLKHPGKADPEDAWWWARQEQWTSFRESGMADCGLETPVAVRCSQEALKQFLVAQNRIYFAVQAERMSSPATRPTIHLVRELTAPPPAETIMPIAA